jgi:phosphatidylserine synthase
LAVFLIVNAFWLLWNGQTELAIAIAFTSMFLDYLDGMVARKYGGSAYGHVFDSLYDVLGWVVFPSLVINIETHWAWWSLIITTLFCLSAVIRLARFTVAGYVKKVSRFYTGLPVLYSKYALLLVLIANAKISVVILAIMIPLMISSRLFKKPPSFLAQLEILYALIFLGMYLRNA